MEYHGQAELTLQCFKPFYAKQQINAHIHVTHDRRSDQVILNFEALLISIPVAEISVAINGVVTTFVVFTSKSAGTLHEFHCYPKNQ